MSRNNFSYSHGDTGTEPANALDFQQNQRPKAQNFDWFWYTVIQSVNGHADEFNRLDSDDDGVVDAADGAGTWSDSGATAITHPTDIDFSGDISVASDGDGTATVSVTKYTDSEARAAVDGANVSITGDADTVDGEHASAFADAGHAHDGTYILEAGDTMAGDLGLGGNDLHGVRQIDGNGGNHRIRFDASTSQLEIHDQSNNRADLAAADVYVADGIGWLSNAVNAGGARTAVDGADVSIAGDADTVDGNHASAFADSGHIHDGRYYTESETRDWVNNNADVPNADYADSAGDADTVDGMNAGDIPIVANTHLGFRGSLTDLNSDHTSWNRMSDWPIWSNSDLQHYSEIKVQVTLSSNQSTPEFRLYDSTNGNALISFSGNSDGSTHSGTATNLPNQEIEIKAEGQNTDGFGDVQVDELQVILRV